MADRPHHLSLTRRVSSACLAIFLLAWGTLGVLRDDLLFLGAWELKLHLRGLPAWLMFGAMTCAAMLLLFIAIDPYDRRKNERYQALGRRVRNGAWALFGAAIAVHVLMTMYSALVSS